jgi:hypothetical protein
VHKNAFNWSIQAIRVVEGGKTECWKLFIDVVRPEHDEMLFLPSPSKSRRMWKSLFFCFPARDTRFKWILAFVEWHSQGTMAERRKKKFLSRLRSTLYFRFWLLLLFIRRLTSRKEPQSNCFVLFLFCFFACALSELYRAKIFDYFSLFTEHSTHRDSRRLASAKTQLHDNVTQCGHETARAKKSGYHHILRMKRQNKK